MADFDKKTSIPLGINWHEGMLLSQHHFQQNDLRVSQIIAHQIRLLSSNHFGVCHLRIDKIALTDGLYRITEIEAVFQDGLVLNYFPKKQAGLKPLDIDISSYMDDFQSSEATIYLCIAKNMEEVSPVLGNPPRFYSIDGDPVSDDNIADNSVRIPRLFPNAFLSTKESIPEFCIGFPLVKIIKIDGVYHIKNWTPPCFFIEKHFPLWKRCSMLSASLREKVVFLAEKLNKSTGTASSYDNEKTLAPLLNIMPGLEALVYSNEIRPYELYQELAEALGRVSVLIPTDIVPVMQPYDHNDIDGCIYPVIDLIEHYVSTVERGFSVLQFNKKDRFFYSYISIDLLEKFQNKKLYIGIRGSVNMQSQHIENWMNSAVIVSDFAIENVRVKRVKGADRGPLSLDIVSKILPGSGVMLFEVEIDPSFVKGEQNLHIFNPGDLASPAEILLFTPRQTKRLA